MSVHLSGSLTVSQAYPTTYIDHDIKKAVNHGGKCHVGIGMLIKSVMFKNKEI